MNKLEKFEKLYKEKNHLEIEIKEMEEVILYINDVLDHESGFIIKLDAHMFGKNLNKKSISVILKSLDSEVQNLKIKLENNIKNLEYLLK